MTRIECQLFGCDWSARVSEDDEDWVFDEHWGSHTPRQIQDELRSLREENRELKRPTLRGVTLFAPTHTFRGLPLLLRFPNSDGTAWFLDEDYSEYRLPESAVTKVKTKPQPGEVWKYFGPFHGDFRLEMVDPEGVFVDFRGDISAYEGNEDYYVKVLNADGTPA